MRIHFKFSRWGLLLLCLAVVALAYLTVSLVMWLNSSTSESRAADGLPITPYFIFTCLFVIVTVVANARRLEKKHPSAHGTIQDGKHCPHCGSDIGVLAVAMPSGRKIRCPYCWSRLAYQNSNMQTYLSVGIMIVSLPLFVIVVGFVPTRFWEDIVLWIFFCLIMSGNFIAALYVRAKGVLVLSSPPPEEEKQGK